MKTVTVPVKTSMLAFVVFSLNQLDLLIVSLELRSYEVHVVTKCPMLSIILTWQQWMQAYTHMKVDVFDFHEMSSSKNCKVSKGNDSV